MLEKTSERPVISREAALEAVRRQEEIRFEVWTKEYENPDRFIMMSTIKYLAWIRIFDRMEAEHGILKGDISRAEKEYELGEDVVYLDIRSEGHKKLLEM